jgi:formate dehydrogenase iron-sulfur subunit
MIKIYVPRDSSALAVGADEVAKAIAAEAAAKKISIQIIRNSSRGMAWLETFVEVETAEGRVGYGPIEAGDVKRLFAAKFYEGGKHQLGHGLVEDMPYLKNQERLTFARAGITDPVSLADYQAHGGFEGLKKALTMTGAAVVAEVTEPGLRGQMSGVPDF